jgi:hypothetical protein
MQTLLKIKEDWILKLQNAKTENDRKIALKRIQKINDELGIFEEENDIFPVADIKEEKQAKIDINLEEIHQEISKLERLYAKFKDQDYLDEISVLKSKIEKAKEQEAVQIIAKDPNVKKFYSETLKMNFVMNKEHEKLIFDDGAVYTFRELHLLHYSEPKPTKKDIELFHTLKLFKGEFIDEYEENPYI